MEKIRICYNVENKNRSKIYILNLYQKKYISSKDIYIYNLSLCTGGNVFKLVRRNRSLMLFISLIK